MITLEQVYSAQNTGLAGMLRDKIHELKKHKTGYLVECAVQNMIYGNQAACSRCRLAGGITFCCYSYEYFKVVV